MLKRFAQEICDITHGIIGHHVLITDEKGLTIGSSDPSRLRTIHTPSLECMSSRTETFTDQEEASRLKDVKPGVTLPICLAGEVMGSIAIAGDHREVARFGYLVQKQAELFIREQVIQESAGARDRAIQELVAYISSFAPGHDDPGILATRIRELGFEPDIPRVCLILEPGQAKPEIGEKALDPLERASLIKEMQEVMRSAFPEPSNFGSSLGRRRFAVFAPIEGAEENPLQDHIVAGCQKCREKMRGMGLILTVGAGSAARALEELHDSYLDAWKALTIGLKKNEPARTHSIGDYQMEDLLTTVNTKKGRIFVDRNLSGLRKVPDREETLHTFHAWCRHPCSPGLVARELNIHRNTLRYRIEKIKKATGHDIRNFRDVFELYMAVTLETLLD